MLSNEEKKQFLKGFLRNIKGISDKEYQKRVWIRGEGPECDDFVDTTCNFFYFIDPILEAYKDYGINQFRFNLIKQFRDEFEKFADENDFPEEFIDTPEWSKITEMAKELLRAFNYQRS